ncbi:MAG: hypothetical protein DRJ96_09950 [Thermoprotei archaeon]|nr:MAG: hypothetical protein DRJ67_00735 [Thermoprotei archaeon]RLE93619.1 MAG: hypothetical protein DRJ96_09950 [Thermoprotei archaeon]
MMKVAVFSLGGCEGCRYSLVEALLSISDLGLELVHEPLLGLHDESYDVAIVEGSVDSREDVEKLLEIRQRARVLVALGTCAVLGGVPGLAEEVAVKCGPRRPLRAAPLSRYVRVDYWVRGCPPPREELLRVLRWISEGSPLKPGESRFPYCREQAASVPGTLLELEAEKCIVCGRCVKVCEEMGVHALGYARRSVSIAVTTPLEVSFDESTCVACGQCVLYCPVGALREVSGLRELLQALRAGLVREAYVEPEALVGIAASLSVPPGKALAALKALGLRRIVVWRPPLPEDALIVPASMAEYLYVKKLYPELLPLTAKPELKLKHGTVLITACLARRLSHSPVVTARDVFRALRKLDVDALPEEAPDEVRLSHELALQKAVGPSQVRNVLESLKARHGVERPVTLYLCPGGCLRGGGQPYPDEAGEEELRRALKAVEQLIKSTTGG